MLLHAVYSCSSSISVCKYASLLMRIPLFSASHNCCIKLSHALMQMMCMQNALRLRCLTAPLAVASVWQLHSKRKRFDCNIQECKGKSAQLAQQDAELAAVKLEVATRLAAHQKLERVRPATCCHKMLCMTLRPPSSALRFTCAVNSDKWAVLSALRDLQAAKDRSDQLQEQLAQGGADLVDAEAQLVKLQKDFRDKCDEVIADKQKSAVMLLHALYMC